MPRVKTKPAGDAFRFRNCLSKNNTFSRIVMVVGDGGGRSSRFLVFFFKNPSFTLVRFARNNDYIRSSSIRSSDVQIVNLGTRTRNVREKYVSGRFGALTRGPVDSSIEIVSNSDIYRSPRSWCGTRPTDRLDVCVCTR